MRVIYVPMGERVWLANLTQRGKGLDAYSGERFQRGYGLGSIFGSLIRSILPIAKKVAKTVGRQALRTGAEVAQDYLQGEDLAGSIKTRGRAGAKRVLNKGTRKIQQRGQGLGQRSKTKAKGIKVIKKAKKPVVRKKRQKRDTLGLFE